MDTNTSLSQSAKHLKKVIPMMSSFKIPFTPVNYAIWYCYVLGRNLEFNLRLDNILKSYKTCPADKARALFDEFLSDKDLALFYEISTSFQDTIEDVKEDIDKTLATSQGFSAFLYQCNSGLQGIKNNSVESYDEVLGIVDQLTEESVLMQQNAYSFQKKLESAYAEISNLKQTLLSTQEAANTDSLTGLYNRGRFDLDIAHFCNEEAPLGMNHALIFIDIDHFKKFNDDFGHQKGDDVLKVVANKVLNACGDSFKGYRYGGEEFCILGDFSGISNALNFAERLRKSIAKLCVKSKKSDKKQRAISASFGIALFEEGNTTPAFVERADKALYLAKAYGRNRVEIA
ncbi:GGDEF domain-containing protein [Pseudoalteromonas sp. Ld20]|uniref:GGDEF domain-containing protein n=1 Tax=Pseudoalteromonas sp. Ld20 TaxID=649165 RepID=UPI003870B115